MKHGGKRNGAGRRPLFAKTKLTQIRVSQDIWDAIPCPKAAWVREAIEEKAKRDNLTTSIRGNNGATKTKQQKAEKRYP